jgi:peroxiredoxin
MRSQRKVLILLSFCVLCFPLAVRSAVAQEKEKAVTPLSSGIPMIEGIKMLEVGSAAPDFSVKDTAGEAFRFGDVKGKRSLLLIFWSIFCEPCRFEMPAVQKMHDKYKADGLDVVSVVLDGEPLKESVVGFMKQENYTFRVLIDELDAQEMFKVADPYGVGGTPTLYLIDKTGKILLARSGRVKEEELEKAVQAALKK